MVTVTEVENISLPKACQKECASFYVVCSPYGETLILESNTQEGVDKDVSWLLSKEGEKYLTSWGMNPVNAEHVTYRHSTVECAYEPM